MDEQESSASEDEEVPEVILRDQPVDEEQRQELEAQQQMEAMQQTMQKNPVFNRMFKDMIHTNVKEIVKNTIPSEN